MKQTCTQCGFQLHLLSQRFYCCSTDRPVCSVCRRKPCKQCLKLRTNEIVIPKCNKCYSRLYENDLLLEYNCERYYCSKCLAQIFLNSYMKVNVEKMYDLKDTQLFVRMFCGHEVGYGEMLQFFQHFCMACGREYDDGLDYELCDGVKVCFMCIKYYAQILGDLLIKCEFCQAVIKNSSNASILENSDMAICQKCTNESKLEQNMISQSRKVQSQKPQQKHQKPQYEQPKPHPFTRALPSKSPTSPLQPPKSPLSKLFKKPSISQLKQKQQQRSTNKSNSNSHSISVTSKFSNNFEEIDQEITESLGLKDNVKLKKHLSNQTYVEGFKIEVEGGQEKVGVKCRGCEVVVAEEVAINLYADTDGEGKGSVSTISLKLLEGGFQNMSINKSTSPSSSYFLCRVCYNKSSQRQKSNLLLNTTTSTRPKSSVTNNRPSKLEDTTSSMDYLKPGKSTRKQMRSPSPSPNKQYSLTGSKESFSQIGQPSSNSYRPTGSKVFQQLSSQKQPPKQSSCMSQKQQPPFPSSHKQKQPRPQVPNLSRQTQPQQNTSQSIPQQKSMKCDLCREYKKSLIATIKQGYLCDDCYYRKNPHVFDRFGRKL